MPPTDPNNDMRLDMLHVANYAQAGFVVVDDLFVPVEGETRGSYTADVQGDNTATVHVETGMTMNINFTGAAVLTFHLTLYVVNQFFISMFGESTSLLICHINIPQTSLGNFELFGNYFSFILIIKALNILYKLDR